ncbi:MAG: DNRLRE domain-containing protein [Candidatus Lloydbacteria bacterium]|nr:DNRLRE domain-containing protein [Candidatus Lloydbacteria bacterium]
MFSLKTTSRLVIGMLVVQMLYSFFPIGVLASTGTFNSTADAYLSSGSPNANNSTGIIMDLINTRDGVVRFDTSSIPSGSTITSATLTLVATAVGSATSIKNYGAHRILVDWTESTVTWNTPGSTAGTHFATSPTDTVAVSTAGSYSWNVTSDVASFIAGSATNYGWRIIWSSNTSGTNKQVDFGTKENTTASNRPVLSVTYTTPDTIAPSAVSDLALSSPSNSAITVSWTAPGDDASTGTAASYDLRYSTSAITSGNFSSATAVTGEPTPLVAGTSQSMTVTGLSPSTTYYFAIKTSDEVPNTSAISNVPSLATTATPDTTAPSAVSDLAASGATASSVLLSWTAPGDDASTGTATSYEIRYSTSNITDGNYSGATQVSGEPAPQAAGASQSMTVTGLSPSTTYYFAIKTSDEVPNASAISNVPSLATTASGGGGGGGTETSSSGGAGAAVLPTRVVISGQAYPGAKVDLLRKSIQDEIYRNTPEAISTVSADGTFFIQLTALLQGQYFFALRIADKDDRKTGNIAFNVDLTSANELVARDLFVPPTIDFETAIVPLGKEIKAQGYAAPKSSVVVEIDGILKEEVKSEEDGLWSFATSTASFRIGNHYARVKQTGASGKESEFSSSRAFRVSLLAVPKSDLNNDDKITIADWSIFLFRWGSKDTALRSKIDMNNDGKIDISDLSIFLKTLKTL